MEIKKETTEEGFTVFTVHEPHLSQKDFESRGWIDRYSSNKFRNKEELAWESFWMYKEYNEHIFYGLSRGTFGSHIVITMYSGVPQYGSKQGVFRGKLRTLDELDTVEDMLGIAYDSGKYEESIGRGKRKYDQ